MDFIDHENLKTFSEGIYLRFGRIFKTGLGYAIFTVVKTLVRVRVAQCYGVKTRHNHLPILLPLFSDCRLPRGCVKP